MCFSWFSLLKEVMRPVDLSLLAFLVVSWWSPLDGRHSLKLQEVLTVGLDRAGLKLRSAEWAQLQRVSRVSYRCYDLKTPVNSI